MQRALILLTALLMLAAPQQAQTSTIAIIDGEQITPLAITENATPASLLSEAGISIAPADEILVDGQAYPLEQPLAVDAHTLQIRRAVTVTLITPDGEQTIQSAAASVGAALSDLGLMLFVSDFISPPADTPLSQNLTITYQPARPLTVSVGNANLQIRSSAETVGQALAGAGIPLLGLDTSLPAESAPLPEDSQIRVTRVKEAILLVQKPIPFEAEFVASNELELDQQGLLQPGEVGLTMSRVRIRFEDGVEISRQTEAETMVRPPQNRIVGYGTQVVVRTTVVDGRTIEYWRAVRMYATSYSPCNSAADRCYNYTSSGKVVKQGVVAMVRANYLAMRGQPLYIPGYGYATIEDVGAGFPDGRLWIDLGYTDEDFNILGWSGWVTVYFVTPVPANILYILY